jgi:hypothetical protein
MTAEQIAEMDAIELQERESERREAWEERRAWREIEHALDELADDAHRASAAALTAAGYHRHHRGEWRKRRGERTDEKA